MKEIFLNILEVSFHGGIIIALVLFLRLVLKNAPRRTICLLWLLAGLRLLLPFEIESSLSLQPDSRELFQPQVQTDYFQSQPVPAVPEDADLPEDVEIVTGDAFADSDYVFYPVQQHTVIDWTAIAAWVWLAGACGLGLYSLGAYLVLCRRVREAVKIADNIYHCPGLDTAFVLGFFRPRIYLPAENPYVLAHEQTHIRRGDHWFKLLGFAVLALHWFNPLVWAGYLMLCRDLEMACDEAVVRDMDLPQRKAYSAALLACAARRSAIAACPVAFGEVSVKQRIVSVLNYRKPRFWICVIAAAAVLFVAVCFLTTPGGMSTEEALAVFYEEMDTLQSSTRLHLVYTMDTDSELDTVELKKQEFWMDGDLWYRTFDYATAEGSFTTCYAQVGGSQYAREYSNDMADFQDRDWQKISEEDSADLPLLTTNWRALEVIAVKKSRTDGGAYTVKLAGDMSDAGPLDTYYEKYWECHLDEDGDLLCMHLFTYGEFYMYYAETEGVFESKTYSTFTVEPWDEAWKEELAELDAYTERETERLRQEAALLKCETAIKDFKSRDSYCVIRENQNTGDILNDSSTTYYYRSGEDWLYHLCINGVDQSVDYYTMKKDGVCYRRESSIIYDPANGASADSGWVEETEVAAYDPWMLSFYWDGADLALTGLSDDGDQVTLTIQGNPYLDDHDGPVEVAEYEATFRFVPGSNTLQSVTLNYVAAWTESVDGQERTDTMAVSAVFSVQDMTDAEIAAVIEAQTPA